MRVNTKSVKQVKEKLDRMGIKPDEPPYTCPTLPNDGWVKSGTNIKYSVSKISRNRTYKSSAFASNGQANKTNEFYVYSDAVHKKKRYYQTSFEFRFDEEHDETFFSYALPYPFSKLTHLLKDLTKKEGSANNHLEVPLKEPFFKETKFCNSLSGLDVPIMTVTSRVNALFTQQKASTDTFQQGISMEIDPRDFKENEKDSMPIHKFKKYIIVAARVHPGESNASFIM